MANPQIMARMDQSFVDRLDKLAEALSKGSPKAVDRAEVIRRALAIGVPELERQLSTVASPKKGK